MRARNIKPGFFRNELLGEVSLAARLLFIGLWTLADKSGRLECRPKRIKADLFPYDDIDVMLGLSMLHERGFIKIYTVGKMDLIQISNWEKHQSPHHKEAPSILPGPTEHNETKQHFHAQAMHEPCMDDEQLNDGASCHPDCLIPDSLITDSKTIPPKPPRGGKTAVQLKTFIAQCKESGEKPISEYTPVLAYAESVRLPSDFLQIAWYEFCRRYGDGGAKEARRQKDWRQTFRNYVEGNYLKLWWINPSGEYELTSAGRQAELANAGKLSQ